MLNPFTRYTRYAVAAVALTVGTTLGVGPGALTGAQSATQVAQAPATADTSARIVGKTANGFARSFIRGTTANGREVTGSFVPLQVRRVNGNLRVRGLIQGVVHNADGTTSRFAALRSLRVRSIEGAPIGAGRTAAAAQCDILNLVLGPLDLDLLGLKVHLNRVVLNIVAESGPGNLLGNLLCAVAGLLDPGTATGGPLGQISNLLNQILNLLRLGV